MKEKKYLSVALICTALALIYAFVSATAVPEESYDEPAYSEESVIDEKEEADEPEKMEEESEKSEKEKEELEAKKKEEIKKEEIKKTEEPNDDNEIIENANDIELEGIITLIAEVKMGNYDLTVVNLNPETGVYYEIKKFSLQFSEDQNRVSYSMADNRYATYRDCFSNDFSKLACTKKFGNNGETHAGWLDSQGNFFDVTEKLGLESKEGFSNDPVYYGAVGFAEDDSFVYKFQKPGSMPQYYYISTDNVSSDLIMEGDSYKNSNFYEFDMDAPFFHCEPTCWLNDTQCIVDYGNDSVILDLTVPSAYKEYSMVDYIPETKRSNWGGISSPDGGKIAFISCDASVDNPPELFTVPTEGGEPVEINNKLPFTRKRNGEGLSKINEIHEENFACVSLLDWR